MSKLFYTKERLATAVQESEYLTEVFQKLGARQGGNTYQRIKALIKEYNIDTSHFKDGKRKGFLLSGIADKKPWQDILVSGKNKRERSHQLRRALIESGRLYTCECCGLGPTWNGKELTLQVDHIDGNWSDCRKENLRFLCPNCHTQMPTYCNQGKGKKCENCNMKVTSKSRWCKRCCNFFIKTNKVERPDLETLVADVAEQGYVATGRKYGVSDNCVRKWIKVETRRKIIVKEALSNNGCSSV